MLLSLQDVSKCYGTSEALRRVSLEVDQGQIVGLLGPNGSGKTTLLRLAAGMLSPTSGRVSVLGHDSRSQRGHFAFHSTTSYYSGWMTARDIEKLMLGLYPDFSADRFTNLLAQLDVPSTPYKALSHGNQTKLALAATLARQVDLYLLDEPLAGIDFLTREAIIEALVREWRDDACVILSTHEIKDAEALFDRVVFMREGEIILDELTDALHSRGESVVDAYRSRMA
jgi:ABC-2 type transport system ATP-binding protein